MVDNITEPPVSGRRRWAYYVHYVHGEGVSTVVGNTGYADGAVIRHPGRQFAGKKAHTALAAALLLLVSLVVVIALFRAMMPAGRVLVSSTLTESLGGLGHLEMSIEFGAGKLTVDSLPDGALGLVEADFATPDRAAGVEMVRKGDEGILSLDAGDFRWRDPPSDWSLHLSRAPQVSLVLRGGTAGGKTATESNVTLDLRHLQVTHLDVDMDKVELLIIPPSHAGHVDMKLDVRAGDVLVSLPKGVAGRITWYDQRSWELPESEGGYPSLDFDTAENRVNVECGMGCGSVRLGRWDY